MYMWPGVMESLMDLYVLMECMTYMLSYSWGTSLVFPPFVNNLLFLALCTDKYFPIGMEDAKDRLWCSVVCFTRMTLFVHLGPYCRPYSVDRSP